MKEIHDGKQNREEALFDKAVKEAAPDLWSRIEAGLDQALPETDAFVKADPILDKASEADTAELRSQEMPVIRKAEREKRRSKKMLWIPVLAAAALLAAAVPAFGLFGRDSKEAKEENTHKNTYKDSAMQDMEPNGLSPTEAQMESAEKEYESDDYSMDAEEVAETAEEPEAKAEWDGETAGVSGSQTVTAEGTLLEEDGVCYLTDYQLFVEEADGLQPLSRDFTGRLPEKILVEEGEGLSGENGKIRFEAALEQDRDGQFRLKKLP